MRILIATTHQAEVGGVETYLRHLLPALRQRGHEVALLTEQSAPGTNTIDAEVTGLSHWSLAVNGAGSTQTALAWKPDICYLQGLQTPEVEAALVDSIPTVLFAHNYHGTCVSGTKRFAFPRPRPCGRTFGPACLALYYPCRCGGLNPRTMLSQFALQKRRLAVLGRCRAVLVASRHMREEYLHHNVAPERLHLAPLFPTSQVPDPAPPAPRQPTGRVLLMGRLTELKGGRFLVEALRLARARHSLSLNLVVAGDGPERPALEKQAIAAGIPGKFHGWVDAVRRTELMRSADLLAVPSVWPEPFGLVGIEAGCVGLPAIGFAVGGIPDWLKPGISGESAPGTPPTAAGLAAALMRALTDPNHWASLCRGAWQTAREFSRERHVECIEQILSNVIREKRSEG